MLIWLLNSDSVGFRLSLVSDMTTANTIQLAIVTAIVVPDAIKGEVMVVTKKPSNT